MPLIFFGTITLDVNSGPAGTTVTVSNTGTGFFDTMTVTVNGTAATNITVVDQSHLTFDSPADSGTVVITNPDGESNSSNTWTNISPGSDVEIDSSVYDETTKQLTVAGSGFLSPQGTGLVRVSLDGSTWIEPGSYDSWATTLIVCTFSSALADGIYYLQVINSNGDSGELVGAFSVGVTVRPRKSFATMLSTGTRV